MKYKENAKVFWVELNEKYKGNVKDILVQYMQNTKETLGFFSKCKANHKGNHNDFTCNCVFYLLVGTFVFFVVCLTPLLYLFPGNHPFGNHVWMYFGYETRSSIDVKFGSIFGIPYSEPNGRQGGVVGCFPTRGRHNSWLLNPTECVGLNARPLAARMRNRS